MLGTNHSLPSPSEYVQSHVLSIKGLNSEVLQTLLYAVTAPSTGTQKYAYQSGLNTIAVSYIRSEALWFLILTSDPAHLRSNRKLNNLLSIHIKTLLIFTRYEV
ncbi:hypothetical protein M514_00068 [Trichuris suis]|uniref:Uncharacterized protein n=1 Tax=Trichuris suis TaxID=68888 RepID=A0A085NTY7_9BILA|nr:hypothetical protein M513_00068 [Trichuris suis]KFD72933.1 hypothetical protein M514_00068 [Trichuris suis]